MKKYLSMLMIIVIVVSCFAFSNSANAKDTGLSDITSTTKSSEWEYSVKDSGTVTITGYTGDQKKIEIPEKIGTYIVDEIGVTAFYNSKIEKITIPGTVKSIGWWAFYNCFNLESVELSRGLNRICFGAFFNCLSLKEIQIPSTVYEIGNDAFAVSCATDTNVYDGYSKKRVSVQNYYTDYSFKIIGYGSTCADVYAENNYLDFDNLGDIHFGDINGDDSITKDDIILIKNYINNSEHLEQSRIFAADLDCNGKINEEDIEILQSYLNGQIGFYQILPLKPLKSDANSGLYGKSMYCDGDSVAKGTGTNILGNSFYSYAHYIRDKYGMSMTNNAVGGTTLAKQKDKKGEKKSILERVEEMEGDWDVILLNGGFNDLFQKIKLGEVTDDSDRNGNYDEYTTAGALEKICYFLNKNYNGSIKLFVICHEKIDEERQDEYWDVIRAVLDKWDIPYVDISRETDFSNINKDISDQYFSYAKGKNTGDGIHPCIYAHVNIYAPLISDKLNELFDQSNAFSFPSDTVDVALYEKCFQLPVFSDYDYNSTISWSSSEPGLAEVDEYGNVTSKGVGTAYIKAQIDDTVFQSYKLNIKNQPQCMFLNKNELELNKGDTFQLKEVLLTGAASYKNEFVSSDNTVVSVSATGLVKAKDSGSAVVICKTCNGIKSECVINVK